MDWYRAPEVCIEDYRPLKKAAKNTSAVVSRGEEHSTSINTGRTSGATDQALLLMYVTIPPVDESALETDPAGKPSPR